MATEEHETLKLLVKEAGLPSEDLYLGILEVDQRIKNGDSLAQAVSRPASNGLIISEKEYGQWIGPARRIARLYREAVRAGASGGSPKGNTVPVTILLRKKDFGAMKKIYERSGLTIAGQVQIAVDLYLHGR